MKYLHSRYDKSCSNSLNLKESCFSASFPISLSSIQWTILYQKKEENAVPQFLAAAACKATHHCSFSRDGLERISRSSNTLLQDLDQEPLYTYRRGKNNIQCLNMLPEQELYWRDEHNSSKRYSHLHPHQTIQ